MLIDRNRLILTIYLISQVSNSWVIGTLFYIIWALITQANQSYLFSTIWLVCPIIVILIVSPWGAKFAETSAPIRISKVSFSLRVISLFCLAGTFIGISHNWHLAIILSAGLFVALSISIDDIFHAPVSFIMAKTTDI